MSTSWDKIKLCELATLKTGKLDSNAAVEGGIFPFFTCSPETYAINHHAFDTTAILLAGNNATGVFPIKYYSGKFNCYQRTYIIETKSTSLCDLRFLFFALQVQLHFLQSLSIGAATKFLTKRLLDNLKIPLPSLPTQQKIVQILSAYDDLIENNLKRIKLLEETAQLTYEEWFVRMKFPGHEDVAVDAETGLPEGWMDSSIGDSCSVSGGGTPSKGIAEYWNKGDILWFSPTDLSKASNLVLLDSAYKITKKGLSKSSAKLMQSNSFMMTSRATIGLFGVIDQPFSTNQGFINVTPHEKVDKYYLLFNFKHRVPEFYNHASGATFLEISKSNFKRLSIVLPNKELLVDWHKTVSPIIDSISNLTKQNIKLKEARDILLPRLMTGLINVEDIDLPTPTKEAA